MEGCNLRLFGARPGITISPFPPTCAIKCLKCQHCSLTGQGVFIFLWPLFARAPCHWFLEFFCCRPPVCKGFFFVAPRWAPRPFGGTRAKKKTPPMPAPNGASPSPAFRRGRSKNKKHPRWCFFFLLWPRRKVAAPNGPQQKKHFAHPGRQLKNSRNQ